MQKFVDWERSITQPKLSVDEQRKRKFLALFLGTVIPALTGFGVLNVLARGFQLEGILIFLGVFVAIAILLALKYLGNILTIFRPGAAFILSLLAYELAIGGGEGVAFTWFYFHPLAAFFLFERREGIFWVAISWIIAITLTLFNLGVYHYPLATGARFIITYTLVCILSYGLELSRNQYYNQLLTEKAALEAALQQVKTLRGLLPICASCKKIRDDAGYWHQVETYIGKHAQVEFSHSICPECRARLYPPRTQRTGTPANKTL